MNWGKLAAINLYECDEKIKNKAEIKRFIKDLCKVIAMKPVGLAKVKRFGKDELEGYSALQFIETSSITCHFDETENRGFIDIFSCKEFDEKKALKFCKSFFNAKKTDIKILIRK